jgi:hypothetical protein
MDLKDIIEVLKSIENRDISDVNGQEFDMTIEASIKIFELINKYDEKHRNMPLQLGGEWLYQDDDGQVDGLQLVGDILDKLENFSNEKDDDDE